VAAAEQSIFNYSAAVGIVTLLRRARKIAR